MKHKAVQNMFSLPSPPFIIFHIEHLRMNAAEKQIAPLDPLFISTNTNIIKEVLEQLDPRRDYCGCEETMAVFFGDGGKHDALAGL